MENNTAAPNAFQKMMNSGTQPAPGQDASGQKKSGPILDTTIQRVFSDLNNLTRRVRLLEERFLDTRKKIELMEENSLALDKELHSQNKATLDTISEQKKIVADVKEKMNIMIKELQSSAKLSDLKVLEKYISMWEPINYVTNEEMDRNVGHLIDLKMSELNLKIQQENFIKKEIERQLSEMKPGIFPSTVPQETAQKSKQKPVLDEAKVRTPEKNSDKIEFDFSRKEKNREPQKLNAMEPDAAEDHENLTYEDEPHVPENKTKEEKDEVEQISEQINSMFRKKNEINGMTEDRSGTDTENAPKRYDEEENIEDLLRR